jgi:hypothetical protein
MKITLTSFAVCAALSAFVTTVDAGLLPKDDIAREHSRINSAFRLEKQACDNLSSNARDICMAEARGKVKIAKADLEARDKGTPKSRQESLVARAEASYEVAKQRCDDLAGNLKDLCTTDAEARFTKAKADALLERKTADANASAADTVIAAQLQASNTKRDADYKAARERCNSLAGGAKNTCINETKSQFAIP